MGIIQKQAIRTTVLTLIGTFVGAFSQFLLPIVLPDKDHVGALALINSVSRIFAMVFTLGVTQITLQIFEDFRNEKEGNKGFLSFLIAVSVLGISLSGIAYYLLEDVLLGVGDEYALIRSVSFLIFPVIFFRILFIVFDGYLRMLFSSVVGALWEGTVLKVVILVGVILFSLGLIDYLNLSYIYALALSLPGLVLTGLAFKKTKKIQLPDRSYFTPDKVKQIGSYGLFGLMATASSVLIVSIDQVMVNAMIGTGATGVYSVMFFAGVLISIPARGVKRIVVPVLTDKWKNGRREEIQEIYEKSVANLSVMACYLFMVGWLCIGPILNYLPQYQEGLYVFFFIGLGQLLDMMTGVNMEIIATSSKYKMNTVFNIILAILVIVLNIIFISYWGIVGAALSSAIAMFVINFFRWFYLKKEFGFQPFRLSTLTIVATATLLMLSLGYISSFMGSLKPIVLAGVLFLISSIFFWLVVLRFNLAPDISEWLKKISKRFLA